MRRAHKIAKAEMIKLTEIQMLEKGKFCEMSFPRLFILISLLRRSRLRPVRASATVDERSERQMGKCKFSDVKIENGNKFNR